MPPHGPDPGSHLILYQVDEGRTRIQCRFEGTRKPFLQVRRDGAREVESFSGGSW